MLSFLTAVPAGSATFRVNSGFDVADLEPGNGLCVAYLIVNPPYVYPFCTLRAAIQEANALAGPDVVQLDQGTYQMAVEGSGEDDGRTGDFDINDSLKLAGNGAGQTVIDARELDRVLDIHNAEATVSLFGLSIMGGRISPELSAADQGGGGIRNRASLVLADSSLVRNRAVGSTDAAQGGGVLNLGDCTIRASTIMHNHAYEGGGIMNGQDARLVVVGSTVENNSAETGAGMCNDGEAELINMTVSGNKAVAEGGALGGGVLNRGQLNLVQSTFAENSALSGGGIYNQGTLSMINSLLAGNLENNCAGKVPIISSGLNLDDNGTCLMESHPGDLLGVDPKLSPLSDNGGPTRTHAIPFSSPARDRGAWLPSVTTDQRGNPRPSASGYDIGAFEAALPSAPLAPLLLLRR